MTVRRVVLVAASLYRISLTGGEVLNGLTYAKLVVRVVMRSRRAAPMGLRTFQNLFHPKLVIQSVLFVRAIGLRIQPALTEHSAELADSSSQTISCTRLCTERMRLLRYAGIVFKVLPSTKPVFRSIFAIAFVVMFLTTWLTGKTGSIPSRRYQRLRNRPHDHPLQAKWFGR